MRKLMFFITILICSASMHAQNVLGVNTSKLKELIQERTVADYMFEGMTASDDIMLTFKGSDGNELVLSIKSSKAYEEAKKQTGIKAGKKGNYSCVSYENEFVKELTVDFSEYKLSVYITVYEYVSWEKVDAFFEELNVSDLIKKSVAN
jgi:hypothetical protein